MGFPINFPQYRIMHVFSHQFPVTWEKTAKPTKWGKPGKLVPGNICKTYRMRGTWKIGTHTFFIVWVVFSIRFPSYGMLHHMGNAWVFSSIFHSIGKDSETH